MDRMLIGWTSRSEDRPFPGRVAAEVAAETAAVASKKDAAGAPPPPPFTGARAISCGLRMFPVAEVESALALTKSLMLELPDVIVGFDLVGQEDPGRYSRTLHCFCFCDASASRCY